MAALQFRKATRTTAPMLLSVAGTSGSGKTFSALLLAAGLAGPNGRVGLIDTENGRGSVVADSPTIVKAFPDGYDYLRFDPPFTPERYIEHIKAAEEAGIAVCIIDSASHEYDGIGGIMEMADTSQTRGVAKWAEPKRRHRKFVYHCLSSQMHIVFCLRAHHAVKMFKKGDQIVMGAGQETSDAKIAEKDLVIPVGLQAIAEKTLQFEMLVSLMLDEQTHFAAPVKVPEPLLSLFPSKHLITKADGERIAQWNSTGSAMPDNEQIAKRGKIAAEDGMGAYKSFWSGLTPAQRKSLEAEHVTNKATAERVDRERSSDIETVDTLPDPVPLVVGTRMRCKGVVYEVADTTEGYGWSEVK